jgi:polyphosphate kinase 2
MLQYLKECKGSTVQHLHLCATLPEHTRKPEKVFKENGRIKTKFYNREFERLQHEMVKLQKWVIETDRRLLMIFEGMDTAGKSSTIKAFTAYLNPRKTWSVALPKPTEVERGQWYFQRHLKKLPDPGEMVFFDRSWYNRAGIEQVFGFCTPQQHEEFYRQVNDVEKMLVDDGVLFFKFYLNIDKATQARRIRDRETDPLKSWKLSELDYKSHERYDTYVELRDKMFRLSGTSHAPWVELDAVDKKRARLNAIRYLLSNIAYAGRNMDEVMGVDRAIVRLHTQS